MLIARWDSCLYGWACLALMSVEGEDRLSVQRWTSTAMCCEPMSLICFHSRIHLCWLQLWQHTHRKAKDVSCQSCICIHLQTYSRVQQCEYQQRIAQKCAACPNQLCWIHKNSLFCMTVVHNQQRDQRRNFPKEWNHEGNVTGFKCQHSQQSMHREPLRSFGPTLSMNCRQCMFFFFFFFFKSLKIHVTSLNI